jgi:broad specificity phosphatase PhoE
MNNNDKFINLYFVRHGYSCANYKKDIAKNILQKIKFLFSKPKDPHLSDKGIKDLKIYKEKVDNKIPKPDLIFSSYLLRAMQTASYLFPKRTIRVAPYIGEIGYGKDNIPNKPSIQYREFNIERHKNRSIVVYPYLGEKGFEKNKNKRLNHLDDLFKKTKIKVGQPINDFQKFLVWLNRYIKNSSRENSSRENSSREINNIVVVSHANYLKKLFRSLNIDNNPDVNNKPNNGSIIKLVLKKDVNDINVYKNENCDKINDYNIEINEKPNCYGVKLKGIPRDKNIKKGDVKNC